MASVDCSHVHNIVHYTPANLIATVACTHVGSATAHNLLLSVKIYFINLMITEEEAKNIELVYNRGVFFFL